MANLTEDGSTWESGIYQLERSDAIDAGVDGAGIANLQALKLANRTKYLKTHVDALEVIRDRGAVMRDVITLTADTTLDRATHMGNLIECSGYTLTLPVTSGMVAGDIFAFKAGLTAAVVITKNTSQTIPEAVIYGFVADTIILQPGEQVVLIWKGGVWKILSYSQVTISSPVGSVVAMASANVPTGWVKCDGASLSRTTYARLFAVIGTLYGFADGSHFNAPDLRGEFIRGWDNSRGVDTGRAIATAQSDLFKAHTHAQRASAVQTGTSGSYGRYADQGSSDAGVMTAFNTDSTGGSETRPRNISMMYCIKF